MLFHCSNHIYSFYSRDQARVGQELPELQDSLLYRGQTLARYLAAREGLKGLREVL